MKTLLQINQCCNILSTGKIAEEIGRVAINNGWRSCIAYSYNNTYPSESETFNFGSNYDFYISYLETLMFDNDAMGLTLRKSTRRLIDYIEKIHPDIIHFHTMHSYYVNIKILLEYLAEKKIPIVWTLHDCWSFTGHCTHFIYVGCNKWKSGCCECPQKHTSPKSYFIDRSKKNYEEKKYLFDIQKSISFVPVSHWLEGFVCESFLKGHHIEVIHNGIDIGKFCPSNNGNIVRERYSLQNKFVILGVSARWGKTKGYDDYVRLSYMLSKNMQIVLVGGFKKEQLNDMPRNITPIKATFNVQELVDIYSTADLFLNCTYQDNYPTVNLEAMACGTPVCTYKTGGSPESIDEKTGFVVEQGDIDGVMNVIEVVSHQQKRAFSNACREKAIQKFDMNKCFQKYIDLYNSIASN